MGCEQLYELGFELFDGGFGGCFAFYFGGVGALFLGFDIWCRQGCLRSQGGLELFSGQGELLLLELEVFDAEDQAEEAFDFF